MSQPSVDYSLFLDVFPITLSVIAFLYYLVPTPCLRPLNRELLGLLSYISSVLALPIAYFAPGNNGIFAVIFTVLASICFPRFCVRYDVFVPDIGSFIFFFGLVAFCELLVKDSTDLDTLQITIRILFYPLLYIGSFIFYYYYSLRPLADGHIKYAHKAWAHFTQLPALISQFLKAVIHGFWHTIGVRIQVVEDEIIHPVSTQPQGQHGSAAEVPSSRGRGEQGRQEGTVDELIFHCDNADHNG